LTFRRTYSSWSHDTGVPGKVIAQLMGHANVDTTLNVYTQVLEGALRAAVDKVGGELFTIVRSLAQRTSAASEPRDRSAPAKRRARERGGGPAGRTPPDKNGAPCKTRTCDLLVRSQTLYPTELRAR
jgi:hypothetical protein